MNSDVRDIDLKSFDYNANVNSKIEFLLKYAILAPSTHNSQPWLFKIENNKCKVYYDPNLLIPQADPKTRDLHISIGCAVENIIIAGSYFSMNPKVNLGPFSEDKLLAEITFTDLNNRPDSNWESLINSIITRINARGFFEDKVIEKSILNKIQQTIKDGGYLDNINIHFLENREKIQKLAVLTAEGLKMAYRNPKFRKEMSGWMNNSLSRRKQGLPGFALKMPFLLSFIIPTLVRYKDIGPVLAGKNFDSINSAPLLLAITSNENNPLTWLKTGRLAERLMLEFNSKRLNTSIFVASVEMGDLYKQVQEVVGTKEIPQFLFAAGKIDSLHKFTPRHELNKKIIK